MTSATLVRGPLQRLRPDAAGPDDLDDFTIIASTILLQHPATLYHNRAAVSPGVHELSLPMSLLGELAFDLAERLGKFRSQKFMRNTA